MIDAVAFWDVSQVFGDVEGIVHDVIINSVLAVLVDCIAPRIRIPIWLITGWSSGLKLLLLVVPIFLMLVLCLGTVLSVEIPD